MSYAPSASPAFFGGAPSVALATLALTAHKRLDRSPVDDPEQSRVRALRLCRSATVGEGRPLGAAGFAGGSRCLGTRGGCAGAPELSGTGRGRGCGRPSRQQSLKQREVRRLRQVRVEPGSVGLSFVL